jgi:ABC-type polysaccharide/polyol phosphate export permease
MTHLEIICRILTLYSWGIVTIIVLFFYFIARFYERHSKRKSFYQLFLIPPVLFLTGALRYSLAPDDVIVEPLGEILFFAGGFILAILGISILTNLMMGGKR